MEEGFLRGLSGVLALGLASALMSVGATAAETDATRPSSRDWTLTLGIEGRVLPSYEGSDRDILLPVPLVDIRRAGTPRKFKAPNDGWSFSLYDTNAFHFGAVGKLRLQRKESDDIGLRGLGDVNWAVELGGFAEYWPTEWLRTRLEVRQGFGGHHGVVGDLSADLVMAVAPRLVLSGGPRLSVGTASYLNPYFGVTDAQAAASGLPAYNASAGARSVGAGAQARYEWSPQWASHMYIEYERLIGSAANSPLVTLRGSRNQITTGIGITYAFDVPGLW